MNGGQWVSQAFLGMLILVPGWLSIGFFNRNYHVSPDLLLVWYFLGGSIGVLLFGRTPLIVGSLVPSVGVVASLIALGIVVCGFANILIFRSVATAPNPGLAIGIANTASVVVFFASAGLAYIAPRLFDTVHISLRSFAGVALTIIGTSLIAMR